MAAPPYGMNRHKMLSNGCVWKHHIMLHPFRKKNNDDIDGGTSLWNEPAVTREGNGTNIAIGTGEPGRCSATESGKKNVRLGIVPVDVKGQSQQSGIARTQDRTCHYVT